jgi:hypothetical protein
VVGIRVTSDLKTERKRIDLYAFAQREKKSKVMVVRIAAFKSAGVKE